MAINNTSYNRTLKMCLEGSAFLVSFGLAETIAWSIISAITVLGTAFSIGKLLKDIHRLPDHNIYVISLLASDFCIGAVAHTTLAYSAYKVKVPCIMARVVESVTYFSVVVSLSSSLVVAINRNRALNFRHSRALNRIQRISGNVLKLPLLIVSLIWLCSVLFTFTFAMSWCDVWHFRAVVGVLCLLVVVANCRLLCKLRKLNTRVHANPNNNVTLARIQRLAVKIVNTLTITLLLTCLPAIIVSLLIRSSVPLGDIVVAFTHKLIFVRPAVDPISYVVIYYILK